jgi:PAS domain S-box-containing protein
MDISVSLVDGDAAIAALPDLDGKHDVLAHIVDAITNPLFVKDEQHRLVVVNDAFCALLGRPRAELIGRTDFDFVPAEQARIFQAKDKVVLETGAADENEEPLTSAAGKQHWIVTRKSLIRTPDGKRYVSGVITDITESKQMEVDLRDANANLKSAMESWPTPSASPRSARLPPRSATSCAIRSVPSAIQWPWCTSAPPASSLGSSGRSSAWIATSSAAPPSSAPCWSSRTRRKPCGRRRRSMPGSALCWRTTKFPKASISCAS